MNGERKRQTHGKGFVNARLTVYSERLGSYPYIAFDGYQEKITNKIHVCIVISLTIIFSLLYSVMSFKRHTNSTDLLYIIPVMGI